jgi:hypothetical protein
MGEAPKRLKDFMPQVLRSMGARPANKLEAVREAWRQAAGALASKVRVAKLYNKVLTLAVESPTLRYEIESVRHDELVARLQKLLPDRAIVRLKCLIG